MSSRRIVDLAAAVTDGEEIDWRTAQARLSNPSDRAIARQLESLSQISRTERASVDRSLPQSTRAPLLSAYMGLTALFCAAALAAHLAGIGPGFSRTKALISGLLAFASAAAVLWHGSRYDERTRSLAGAYWAAAASFAVVGSEEIIRHAALDGRTEALLLGVRPEVWMPACLWSFAQRFPTRRRFDRVDTACGFGVLIAICAGGMLFIANLAPGVHPLAAAVTRTHDQGRWFWLVMFGAVLPALPMIALRARGAEEGERRRTRLFLLSIAAGLTPLTLAVLAESTIPAFRTLIDRPRIGTALGYVIYPPMLLAPLASAYALLIQDVFSIRATALRSLRYVLSGRLGMVLFALSVAVLAIRLYGFRDVALAAALGDSVVRTMITTAGVGIALGLGRRRIIRLLDRRGTGDEAAPAFLALVSERLRNARTPLEIADEIARAASSSLATEAVPMLGTAVEEWTRNGSPLAGLSHDSLIPILLIGSVEPARLGRDMRDTHYWLVNDTDRRWIDAHRIQLVCPLFAGRQASRPFAVIALRQRPDGRPFTNTDGRLLSAAAGSASLAFQALEMGSVSPPAAAEFAHECPACGRVAMSADPACACRQALIRSPLPAAIGNRYRLQRRIGAGAMGVVYIARDDRLARDVALKTLVKLSSDAATRLMQEAQALASVAQPHVAVLYDVAEWQGTPILAMEWLEGGTLQTMIAERRTPSPAETFRLLTSLASALGGMHASGLVHGDIKPSNIGFLRNGTPKFLDFGLARRLDAGERAEFGGTLAYLSPDVLAGAIPGPELDVWALTVVAVEALTAKHPFLAGRATPSRIARGLDPGFLEDSGLTIGERTFFVRALGSHLETRPDSADTLAAAFSNFADLRRSHEPPRR